MIPNTLTIQYTEELMQSLGSLSEIWKCAFEGIDLPGLPLKAFCSPSYPQMKHWNVVLPIKSSLAFNKECIEFIKDQFHKKGCAPFFQIPTGYASSVKMNAYFSKIKEEDPKIRIRPLCNIQLVQVKAIDFGMMVAHNISESERFGQDFTNQIENLERRLPFAKSFSVNLQDKSHIACISIFSSDLEIFWLKNLIVHPNFRRKGLGITTMASVESFIPTGKKLLVQLGTPQETSKMVKKLGYSHVSDTALCSVEEILRAIP